MKLFSISSPDLMMDAMFYIQASTKHHARHIFGTLTSALNPNFKLTLVETEKAFPSISPISLSLKPWSMNPQSRTREFRMATHGLILSCTVTEDLTRQIVDFCDNLGRPLDNLDDKTPWINLINSDCALLNTPRLYSVLLNPGTPAQFEIFVPALDDGCLFDSIGSVVEECFGKECQFSLGKHILPIPEKPVIRLEAYLNDRQESVFELTFSLVNLSLSALVTESQLRCILILCEDFGVRLQGRAGASCQRNMRYEYRRLAHVGTCSRPGHDSDVRSYTSFNEQIQIQDLFDRATRGSKLVPARHSQQYNGVLLNATPASATTGFIYLSKDFLEGQFMMTAEVLNAGKTPDGISYIETLDGYRFIVTAFESRLMDDLFSFLTVNEGYLRNYYWS